MKMWDIKKAAVTTIKGHTVKVKGSRKAVQVHLPPAAAVHTARDASHQQFGGGALMMKTLMTIRGRVKEVAMKVELYPAGTTLPILATFNPI